jgi:hypothetical protein
VAKGKPPGKPGGGSKQFLHWVARMVGVSELIGQPT